MMRGYAIFLIVMGVCAGGTADAAGLRAYRQISGPLVHLGDLFDQLGETPDRVLGPAPAPGGRIVVRAAQLAAIARDFGVDWRPQTGDEQLIVARGGELISPSAITQALRTALISQSAPADFDISAPDSQPVLVPIGSHVTPRIDKVSYDARSGNFTALVVLHADGMQDVQWRVSGSVIAMVQAATATHELASGHVVAAGDVVETRVRARLLRDAVALLPAGVIGLVLRHDVRPGEALSSADVGKQIVVQRGQIVRMLLNDDGIALSAQGLADGQGGVGDRIRVENPASHIMLEADITGPGEVRVAPHMAVASLMVTQ